LLGLRALVSEGRLEQASQGEGYQDAEHRGGRHQGKGRPSMPAKRSKKNAHF